MTAPVVAAGLADLVRPVAGLVPYARNPRRGDVEAITASLLAHGQYRPIVVRRGTLEVLAGNHTLRAAIGLGWDALAVTFVDCDDAAAARIVLQDNEGAAASGYDLELLAAALGSLPDLDGTGWTDPDLEAILAAQGAPDGFAPPADPPGPGDHPDDGEPAPPAVCPACSHAFARPTA